MDQIKIVFVDVEEDYLMMLVMKFIESLGDKVDIVMITELDYLEKYLSEPHELNLLIIKDSLYDKRFERFMINHTFFLTEKEEIIDGTENSNKMIYKYSSIDHIFTKIASLSGLDKLDQKNARTTQLIMLYSPIGGSGKTYTSIGIARALGALNKKVLYLNTESVQDFNYYLKDQSYATREFEQALIRRSESMMEQFRDTIRRDTFDYLPPFEQSIIALNINKDSYQYLIQKIQELGIYDYIILETSSEFTYDNVTYMGLANKVLIVANQDVLSVYKLERFLSNIDYAQQDKFKIICNRYSNQEENYLVNRKQECRYEVLEYIRKEEKQSLNQTLDKYVDGGFQRIAYYLI